MYTVSGAVMKGVGADGRGDEGGLILKSLQGFHDVHVCPRSVCVCVCVCRFGVLVPPKVTVITQG